MFERFTDRARQTVVLCQEEARRLGRNYIGTEHILLGLIREGEGVGAAVLESLGISLDAVRQQVEEIIGRGQEAPPGHISFTPRAKKVLELSLREALQLGHNHIGTEHILLGLIREGDGVAAQVLVRLGADLNRVRQQVITILHGPEGQAPTEIRPDPVRAVPAPGSPDIHPASENRTGEQAADQEGSTFQRFTDEARRVVVLAQEEARMLNHNYIGTEHILLGLLNEGEGVAARTLESLGISLAAVRQQVEEIIGQGQQTPTGLIPFTPRAKKVLELSLREALQLGHNHIGTEHILLGLIREGDGVAAQLLVKLGADLNRVRQQVTQLLYGYQAGRPTESAPAPATTAAASVDPSPNPESRTDAPTTDQSSRFQRFTDRARRAIVLAQEEARMLNHNYIGTEHILAGLIDEGEGVAARALESLGISVTAVRQQIEEIVGRGDQTPSAHIPFTPRARRIIELSLREALQLGHNYIGTEHLLLAIVRLSDGTGAQILVGLGADLNRVRQQVIQLLHGHQDTASTSLGMPYSPQLTGDDIPVPERFTDRAQRVVRLAQDDAGALNHNYLGSEHLLLGLLHEGEGVGAAALQALGISHNAVQGRITEIIGRGQQPITGRIPLTPRARAVLRGALAEATHLGHNYIGTEHILLGIVREGDGVAAQVLVGLGADLNRIRQQVIQLLHGYQGRSAAPESEPEVAGFSEYSERARRMIILCQEEARMLGHDGISPESILLSLIQVGAGIGAATLEFLGVGLAALRQDVEQAVRRGQQTPPGHIPFTPQAREVLDHALLEARRLGDPYIGTQHILLGLIGQGNGVAAEVLAQRGAGNDRIRQTAALITSTLQAPGRARDFAEPSGDGPLRRNLTQVARDGGSGPILGRSGEIQQLVQALSPDSTGSPLLIGEHGVGVSSVVYGLAQAALRPDGPRWLAGRDVREIDLRQLAGSPASRDDIGERADKVIAYISGLENTILFVRNAFAPLQTSDGIVHPVSFLRSALSDGHLRVIAAASPAEYRGCVSAGEVPAGVFREIPVEELPGTLIVAILQETRDSHESRHQVEITDDAIAAAVTLSARHIPGRPLPGKAIDLLDRAAGRAARRNVTGLVAETRADITDIRARKETAIDSQDFALAAELRDQEKHMLLKVSLIEHEWDNRPAHRVVAVDSDDVTEALKSSG